MVGISAYLTGTRVSTAHDRWGTGEPEVTKEVRILLARLADGRRDEEAAVAYGRWLLDRNREHGVSLAAGWKVIGRWEDDGRMPPRLLLLRARFAQREHRFQNARNDLDALLRLDPRNTQAWLDKATLHQAIGEYDEARLAAARLVPLANPFVSTTLLCHIESVTGLLEASYVRLAGLEGIGDAAVDEKVWAFGILADMALRLGLLSESEEWLAKGLKLRPRDGRLLAAMADIRLARGDVRGVRRLLGLLPERPSLALRVAITGAAGEEQVRSLRDWFAGGAAEGHRHDREEVMFRLHVTDEPGAALWVALRNWEAHREPTDALLVLESALAAGDPAAAKEVLEWLDRTGLEDVRMVEMRRRLQEVPRKHIAMPDFKMLERDAVRLAYPDGWENLAHRLRPWIARQIRKPANRSALDRLRERDAEVLAMVCGRLGVEEADARMAAVLSTSLETMAIAAEFPDVRHVQLWDQARLRDFLSSGGRLRGLEFDRAKNEFTRQVRVRSGVPGSAAGPVAVPLFLSGADDDEREAEAKDKLRRLIATRRRDLAVRAGQCIHEVVEDWLVRETGLRAEGKRWMREGIANVIAAAVLAEVLDEEASRMFLEPCDAHLHEAWKERVKLDEWKNGESGGSRNLELARYAFATAEVLQWDDARIREEMNAGRNDPSE